MPRNGRRRPRQTPHPTATLLLETAVALLDTTAIDGVTIAKVLETSGVSYGSLYHHYSDISDLIEQAVVFRYTRGLLNSLAVVRSLLDSHDSADFRRRAEELIEQSISPERRPNRLERVEIIGALHGRPRLVALLAQAQQDITNEQAEIYREFQRRGWIRSDADPVALSAFVQAMTVGRIVDDIALHPVDADRWYDVAIRAFRAVLFPD
jgi:AcrR family transcriptional regulator